MIPNAMPTPPIDPTSSAPKNNIKDVSPENGDKFAKVLDNVSSNKEAQPDREARAGQDAPVKDQIVDKTDKETGARSEIVPNLAPVDTAIPAGMPVPVLPVTETTATPVAETTGVGVAESVAPQLVATEAPTPQGSVVQPIVTATAPVAAPETVAAPQSTTPVPPAVTGATATTTPTVPAATTEGQDTPASADQPATTNVSADTVPTTPGTTVAAPPADGQAAPVAAPALETDVSPEKLLETLARTAPTTPATGEQVATTDSKQAPGLVEALTSTNTPRAADTTTLTAAKTAATQQAPLPEPVRQVVSLVAPLRHHGDGDYKLTLQLHPEHLGRVEVAVALNAGQISMQLSSDNAASRQMLKEHMNELRQALQDSGLDAGSLDVGSQSSREQETAQSGGNSQIHHAVADGDEDELFARLQNTAAMKNVATDGPLDVRM